MNPTLPEAAPRARRPLIRTAPAVLAALVAFAAWWSFPGALLVREVRFEGNTRASEAALRHLADIPNGTGLLGVDLRRAARGVERHPWVREAYGRYTWRGVALVVEEHRVVALAHLGDRLVYVDERGVPFLAARTDDLDHPVISGLDAELAALHPSMVPVVLRDATGLLDSLDARGLVPPSDISEISFRPTRGFTVHLRSGAQLLFGLDQHPAQLGRLAALVAEGVDLHQRVHVDLAPSRVAIVRPIDATAPRAADGGA